MVKTNKNNVVAYISPIIVHNELLRGAVFVQGVKKIQVAVYIDSQLYVRAFCDAPVPVIYQEVLGAPKVAKGFVVPLPERVFDGASHELIIRLCKESDKKIEESLPNDIDHYSLLESRLVFRHGACHGHVALVDQYIKGWVAFSHRSNPLPQLTLRDEQENLIKQISLIPLPTETGNPDKYLASFRIPQDDLPIPLHVYCGEIELSGSPCQAPKKLIGFLEKFEVQAIHGWAFDMHQPGNPIELALKINGKVIDYFRPNVRRTDIANHLRLPMNNPDVFGFNVKPPEFIFDGKEHRISVEFAELNHPLRGSGQLVKIPRAYQSFEEIIPSPKKARQIKTIDRPNRPLVSVIILNRNGKALLEALFESWKKQNSVTNIELIVVDHASEDGSLKLLAQWRSQIPLHIIPLSFNDSFSASCNRAAKEARGQFLLFMNNDIIWLQDALPEMIHTLESDHEIGVLGIKLIKSTDNEKIIGQAPVVQHLGVRFKLNGVAYWPYEVTPEENEAEYSPQNVPVVTGAVMLCRKKDFLDAGQFDSSFFYGFEDVEFCMRLSNRLNKKIICRNDLLALHYHGHTRLSGRAADIFDRVNNNADILQENIGLWLKRNYWMSLINGDRYLTIDKLTIGFVIDEAKIDEKSTRLQTDAGKLAKQILKCYPTARIVFLPPRLGWYNVRNIHLLIVGYPEYDISKTILRREDLLIAAWIRDDAKQWTGMPWWQDFDSYLTVRASLVRQLAPTISNKIAQITAEFPLGALFRNQLPPLRVALLIIPCRDISIPNEIDIDALQRSLKAAGAVVWEDSIDTPNGLTRVADVRIAVCLTKKIPQFDLKSQPHTLNILWIPHIKQTKSIPQPKGWKIINQMPQADWLHKEIEIALGNTFRSS